MLLKKLFILALFVPLCIKAQNNQLVIEGNDPGHYLTHNVGAKENFYSIGRLYNVSPREHIAPFNHLQLENGLKIGQALKIPLVESNFSRDGITAEDEVLVPVYHIAKDRETLSRVSAVYQTPVAALKRWNNLPGESIANGKKLIVGYLKVKKDLSSLASRAVKVQPEDNPIVVKTATDQNPADRNEKNQPVVKVHEKKEPETYIKPVEKKPESTQLDSKNFSGGYFRSQFEKQGASKTKNEVSGTAGVFKSTSGWEDGKYYCLHNGAPAGTIIRITSNNTQKSVYAKVLDMIPDLKQNEGLVLRLSNAAADELGERQGNFECTIKY